MLIVHPIKNSYFSTNYSFMNLITGGTGLVGSHLLLLLLEKGESVRAIYRNESSKNKTKRLFELYEKGNLFSKIEWVQADINDIPSLENAFEGVLYVYHCAAYVSLSSSDNKMYKINIEGTANMVNLSIDFGIKKFCYVSSIAALGTPENPKTIITEETEWNPNSNNTDYAITKYGGEMEVFRGSQENLEVIVVNPGIILGPEFWNHGSALFFKKVKKGMFFYTKGKSGFVAVTDVVRAMYELMKSEIKSERFILVAENLSLQDFLNQIADSVEAKRPNYYAKPWLTNLGAIADKIFSSLFFKERSLTKSMSDSAHSETIFSNEKIKEALQLEFTDLSLYIKQIGKHYLNTEKHK